MHDVAGPFQSIPSRSNPIHTIPPHFSRVRPAQSHPSLHASGHACRQRQASRQAGGKASRQATINAHRHAGMQAGKQASRQANKQANMQDGRHAGMWVFACLLFSSQMRKNQWEQRYSGDPGYTKEPGDPGPSNVGVYRESL